MRVLSSKAEGHRNCCPVPISGTDLGRLAVSGFDSSYFVESSESLLKRLPLFADGSDGEMPQLLQPILNG